MNFDLNLKLKQSQKLILTQQMRQSIEILQMTSMELNTLINQTILENPVLNFNNSTFESLQEKNIDSLPKESKDSVNWDDYFQNQQLTQMRTTSTFSTSCENNFTFEDFSTQTQTLNDYLLLQFHMHCDAFSKKDLYLGEFIIESIDENGYLDLDPQQTALMFDASLETIHKIIELIQTFDPSGVGARTLSECLLIQLKEKGLDQPFYPLILNEYLKDLAANRYQKIHKATSVSVNDLTLLKKQIATLEPKPGQAFHHSTPVNYILPDAVIAWENNQLHIKINEISAPHLKINPYYQSLLHQQDPYKQEAQAYIKKKLDDACLLIKNINQRRNTLYSVIETVVTHQKDFFFGGLEDLKPLTLKMIADSIEMHPSTVSRSINGTFIQTPKGVYPLKFFFKRGLSADETNITTDQIHALIKTFIQNENPEKPLSDQKIMTLLNQKDILIARRTVSKYREEMDILPSNKRKVHK